MHKFFSSIFIFFALFALLITFISFFNDFFVETPSFCLFVDSQIFCNFAYDYSHT